MERKRILIVVDPIPTTYSVQFDLVKSLSAQIVREFDVYLSTNFIDSKKATELEYLGIRVLRKKEKRRYSFIKKILFPRLNESLLWGVNWFLDLLAFKLGKNAIIKFPNIFDYVVNLSSTAMCESDLLWIQGPPFAEVVESMASNNYLSRLFLKFFKKPLENGSRLSVTRMASLSRVVIANSRFVASRYKGYPFRIDSVIYTSKEFSQFMPINILTEEKYVLTYIGKETDLIALEWLLESGIKLKAFGAKIPPGFNLSRFKNKLSLLGYVSQNQLVQLYSCAHFVAFPFTNEPFGYVPIESMLCGTPVLSYDKEGPSETILDGITGWLVKSREEFIEKALQIWRSESTGIAKEECIKRGKEFTTEYAVNELLSLLNHWSINEINSYN